MEDTKRIAYGNYKDESYVIYETTYKDYNDIPRTYYEIDIYPQTMDEVCEDAINRLENWYYIRLDFYTETFDELDTCYRFLLDRSIAEQ